ncbi:response regulator [Candidatus Manganitrophus noduliformans]|uniref:Response regulator n=1 Tax=Candidatus Manganitrophus noduliformans TaxID=2606439 RepID=A0A7X6DS41_9BACT|nr:response regulator [Candidatus Manganitrophus noduliformans]NKE72315.1 response regulator [Candidatus Manganitrophus noduliformans]
MADIRFLVVEDSPTMRQLITFSLKRIPNSKIVEASDGVDALKKLKENRFDLIVSDINMPLMDGLKLVSMIRSDPAYRSTPIVIVTTEGSQTDREKGLALGANAYLSKPIQTNELLKIVRDLLKAE